jgi:hypothetical protein
VWITEFDLEPAIKRQLKSLPDFSLFFHDENNFDLFEKRVKGWNGNRRGRSVGSW